MNFVIVTGLSGAGKVTALKMLEDIGYFCVDNLPIRLLDEFVKLMIEKRAKQGFENIALCLDVRSGYSEDIMEAALSFLKQEQIPYSILFMEATDACLIKRYKETRRKHPLAGNGRVEIGIAKERVLMASLRKQATYIFDTSQLLTRELRTEIEHIFKNGQNYQNLMVTILSFGFKYGIPADSDLVFDVRFLPNPYYIEELRPKTGNDKAVQDFVMNHENSQVFLDKLTDMVRFLIGQYEAEKRTQLIISIGCTGGKHRSVTLANALHKALLQDNRDYGLKVEHRDIEKDAHRKKMS